MSSPGHSVGRLWFRWTLDFALIAPSNDGVNAVGESDLGCMAIFARGRGRGMPVTPSRGSPKRKKCAKRLPNFGTFWRNDRHRFRWARPGGACTTAKIRQITNFSHLRGHRTMLTSLVYHSDLTPAIPVLSDQRVLLVIYLRLRQVWPHSKSFPAIVKPRASIFFP